MVVYYTTTRKACCYKAFFGSMLCVICLFVLACEAGESRDEVGSFLEQLEAKHSNTKSLAVKFEQRKHLSFMSTPLVSEGRMFFAEPGLIRFELLSPYRSVLLNNNKSVSRYEYSDSGWREVKFGAGKSIKLVTDQISGWMQGKFSGQSKLFDFSISNEDPNSYKVLTLTPKSKAFRKYIDLIGIRFGALPDMKILQININEPEGDFTSMYFRGDVINGEISGEVFEDPAADESCSEALKSEGAGEVGP